MARWFHFSLNRGFPQALFEACAEKRARGVALAAPRPQNLSHGYNWPMEVKP